MEGQLPFYVERAKTGRASCRGCRSPCLAGELRIAKIVIGPYGENQPMKTWYHIDCLMNAFMKQRKTTKRISSVNEIGNFVNLTQEDKEFVLQKINDMEIHYGQKNKCQPNVIKDDSDSVIDTKSEIENTNIPSISKDIPSTSKDIPRSENLYPSHQDNLFVEFYGLCKKIAQHDKYTDKTEIVKNFFLKGTDGKSFHSDILVWTKLLLPGVVKKVYNLKKKQLVKLFSRIFRVDEDEMLTDLEKGNVGETLKTYYVKSYKTCASNSTLTVFEIEDFLNTLTTMTKEDEQTYHFNSILGRCTAEDLKYIIYLINGDLKMNAGCKHILNALHPDAYSMYQSSSDMDNLISRLIPDMKASSGIKNISPKKVDGGLQLMVPISPMLAEACKSSEMAMKKCPNGMLSEIKYDGERVQLHKAGKDFQYFSRSLKNVMDHKIAHFKKYIPQAFPHGNDLVLDSEVLMVNTKTGELLPFGSLGVHKKNQFQDAQVCLFVFDCMYYNGESLINKPLRERRKILKQNMTEIKNRVMFSEAQEIHKISKLEIMMATVFKKGLEGLVLKDLESKYEPGKRHWLKLKKDYLLDGQLADSADLVVIGAWFGNGKKGGILSIFLMGCYDEEKNRWLTVTKVSTGHDDDTLASLQTPLMNGMTKISRDSNRVPTWMRCTKTMVPDFVAKNPKEQPVWEISGAEFSQAAIHTADGISIRFPRVARIREDKDWNTATSFKELKLLYENSKENKDYSYLIKSDLNAPGCSKTTAEDEDGIFDCSELDEQIELSVEQHNLKRKQEEDDDINPAKKLKQNLIEVYEEIGYHTPKIPLLNIFSNITIFFCEKDSRKLEDTSIKKCIRYWIAYGGKITKDGSQANYVIHLNESIIWEDYLQMNLNISYAVRHVNINWLKKSVYSKEIIDSYHYGVRLFSNYFLPT